MCFIPMTSPIASLTFMPWANIYASPYAEIVQHFPSRSAHLQLKVRQCEFLAKNLGMSLHFIRDSSHPGIKS